MMSGPNTRRPRSRSTTLLLFIEGLSSSFGFLGGIPLIADPSGVILGLPLGGTKALSSLPIPIHDFFLAGLWIGLDGLPSKRSSSVRALLSRFGISHRSHLILLVSSNVGVFVSTFRF